jgi:hypothetical protein
MSGDQICIEAFVGSADCSDDRFLPDQLTT